MKGHSTQTRSTLGRAPVGVTSIRIFPRSTAQATASRRFASSLMTRCVTWLSDRRPASRTARHSRSVGSIGRYASSAAAIGSITFSLVRTEQYAW